MRYVKYEIDYDNVVNQISFDKESLGGSEQRMCRNHEIFRSIKAIKFRSEKSTAEINDKLSCFLFSFEIFQFRVMSAEQIFDKLLVFPAKIKISKVLMALCWAFFYDLPKPNIAKANKLTASTTKLHQNILAENHNIFMESQKPIHRRCLRQRTCFEFVFSSVSRRRKLPFLDGVNEKSQMLSSIDVLLRD